MLGVCTVFGCRFAVANVGNANEPDRPLCGHPRSGPFGCSVAGCALGPKPVEQEDQKPAGERSPDHEAAERYARSELRLERRFDTGYQGGRLIPNLARAYLDSRAREAAVRKGLLELLAKLDGQMEDEAC
jgi:hypothetical protein